VARFASASDESGSVMEMSIRRGAERFWLPRRG
jgi:hypothetical protein